MCVCVCVYVRWVWVNHKSLSYYYERVADLRSTGWLVDILSGGRGADIRMQHHVLNTQGSFLVHYGIEDQEKKSRTCTHLQRKCINYTSYKCRSSVFTWKCPVYITPLRSSQINIPLLTDLWFACINLLLRVSPADATVRTEGTWALGGQHFGSGSDVSRWSTHRRSRRATQEPAAKDWCVYTLSLNNHRHIYVNVWKRNRGTWLLRLNFHHIVIQMN